MKSFKKNQSFKVHDKIFDFIFEETHLKFEFIDFLIMLNFLPHFIFELLRSISKDRFLGLDFALLELVVLLELLRSNTDRCVFRRYLKIRDTEMSFGILLFFGLFVFSFKRSDLISEQLILIVQFVIIKGQVINSELESFEGRVDFLYHVVFVFFIGFHFAKIFFCLSFIMSNDLLFLLCEIFDFCTHVSQSKLKLRFKLRKLFSLRLYL